MTGWSKALIRLGANLSTKYPNNPERLATTFGAKKATASLFKTNVRAKRPPMARPEDTSVLDS